MKLKAAFLFILVSIGSYAQVLHFKVIGIEDMKPLSGVKMTAVGAQKEVLVTDIKGEISLNHLVGDTIVFTKETYFPVSVSVSHKNYDFNHMMEVIMIPKVKKTSNSAMELQSFQYRFIHDTLGEESHLNITVLEPKEAMLTRNVWKERSFRFTHIDVKGKTEKSNDSYDLQK